ncbi:Dabb family protein [Streptosporangium sp. NPDC000239]|uniref:Dabb family protein n=1 Tax=Streptosporangium jomthongense TaxID=1193683 RepID=A0ABV8FD54_9ACTN
MIKRVVLVRTDRPARIDDELARLAGLRGTVPCLRDIEVAADIGGRCLGYDRMFALSFGDAEDIAAWSDHPAHAPLRTTLLRDAELLVFEYRTPTIISQSDTKHLSY